MSDQKKKQGSPHLRFLTKTWIIAIVDALLTFYLTEYYVYANLSPGWNAAAHLFPQPIVINGWTFAYLTVWFLIFTATGLVLFSLGYRKA